MICVLVTSHVSHSNCHDNDNIMYNMIKHMNTVTSMNDSMIAVNICSMVC